MSGGIWVELSIILILVLANGFFSGAEIAIIAAGRGRLQQQAAAGHRGAKLALQLAEDPNRFLPTVQVGITLIGTLAAAYGGARITDTLAAALAAVPIPWVVQRAETIAFGLVVLAVTYLSVVVGELVPKRIALQNANALASIVAWPMHALLFAVRPAVWVMARSTDAVLAALGFRGQGGPSVSLDDIQFLIETGTAEGLVAPVEQRLAVEALRLGETTVKDIMRPRLDIDAIDVETPPSEVFGALTMAGFSRLPVYEGDLDHVIGYVHLKDVLRNHYLGWEINLRKLLHPSLFVPASLPIDRLLVLFQEQRNQLAIVLDEFGGTDGMVTLEDVLAELVGEILSTHHQDDEQRMVPRDNGTWLVDGAVHIEDLAERMELKHSDLNQPRNFSTVSGLILTKLERIPRVGESVNWLGRRWEVVDMDGPRIDRVLVGPLAEDPDGVPPPKGEASVS